jgi:two-component system, NarL family, invasion response regulator UvrY
MPKIRILVVDDHPTIIDGLTATLGPHGIEVVASTTSFTEMLQLYDQETPDVVILDIRFGKQLNSMHSARELLLARTNARIIFYSQHDDDESIRDSYQIGGAAFVSKSGKSIELAEAIKRVHEGETHFPKGISERLALMSIRGTGSYSPIGKLNERELQIFILIAEAKTNVEIAEITKLAPKTVSVVTQSIKEKLGVHRHGEITRLAIRHGLIRF